jgi:hypothetical protein
MTRISLNLALMERQGWKKKKVLLKKNMRRAPPGRQRRGYHLGRNRRDQPGYRRGTTESQDCYNARRKIAKMIIKTTWKNIVPQNITFLGRSEG